MMISICSCKSGQGKSAPQDILDQGEVVVGEYQISYVLSYNEIVAHVIPETIKVEPGASREVRNKSLFLTVKYAEEIILNNKEIRTTCFEDIEDAGKFILGGPQVQVDESWFKVVDDLLVVEFGAFVEDTDWGYIITFNVDKNGQVSSTLVNVDDLYTE